MGKHEIELEGYPIWVDVACRFHAEVVVLALGISEPPEVCERGLDLQLDELVRDFRFVLHEELSRSNAKQARIKPWTKWKKVSFART